MITHQPLPQNAEAERALLGSMIMDNTQVDVALELMPVIVKAKRRQDQIEPLFFDARNQAVWDVISELHAERRPFSLQVVVAHLARCGTLDMVGGAAYVAGLEDDIFALYQVPELASVVADHWRRRVLIRFFGDLVSRATAGGKIDEIMEQAERRIFEIAHERHRSDFEPIGDIAITAMADLEREAAGQQSSSLTTGLISVDRFVRGFRPGNLILIAARPSVGKSAFADNIAFNVASQGKPVGFFEMEMSKAELALRIISRIAKIPHDAARDGSRANRADLDSMHWASERLDRVPLLIDDDANMSASLLRTKARKMRSRNPDLALLVVDYLQLMRGSGRDENRQQELTEISRSIKLLAMEMQIPIIALSQMSREFEKRRTQKRGAEPQLADLRESGALEQDADIVIFLDRDVDDQAVVSETKFFVRKFRGGKPCKFKMGFRGQFTEFVETAH